PSTDPELAHTGGSSATNAAIGAGAVGLIGLGAGTVYVVRRRALR
ncbi:LAETG motif-containing sortase-dependent surface protein, partial [Streptomyces sp. WAC05374]